MFTEFTVGDRTYKLRLTTQGVISLEKTLGVNPLQIFMGIDDDVLPKMTDLITILHQMLQPYEHGIRLAEVYEIYDAYIEDGHTMWDLVEVLINAFMDAGFLPKANDEDEESKN